MPPLSQLGIVHQRYHPSSSGQLPHRGFGDKEGAGSHRGLLAVQCHGTALPRWEAAACPPGCWEVGAESEKTQGNEFYFYIILKGPFWGPQQERGIPWQGGSTGSETKHAGEQAGILFNFNISQPVEDPREAKKAPSAKKQLL